MGEIIKDYCVADIIVPDDYLASQPLESKLKRREDFLLQHGTLPPSIVLNADGVLIDGYITYLTAVAHGIDRIDVRRGHVELIEARHGHGDKLYRWKVPGRLQGRLAKGDKCLVVSGGGVSRVTVEDVYHLQYPPQYPRLNNVVKICERRENGAENQTDHQKPDAEGWKL